MTKPEVLVLVECEGGAPATGALCAVTAAQPLGAMHLVAHGDGALHAAGSFARLPGVARVIVATGPDGAALAAESLAASVAQLVRDAPCTHVLASAGASARALLPRAAALLGVMAFSEVIRVVDLNTCVRPVHAGSALMTVQSNEPVHVFSIRASSFKPAEPDGSAPVAPVHTHIIHDSGAPAAKRVARQRPDTDAVELVGARVVVSGGRGVGSAEGFTKLKPLAKQLGAAVGASRAAVDAGYAAADSQVGQTGKSVAPDLYIALGISGAVQHWAGMKDSKVIVAVNKDPEAPIFQFADYYMVGDLFEVLPALEQAISAAEASVGIL
jgi:electron transfer flavoprotein alpha subunit